MSYRQTIYNRLRQAGMTEAGALAMLGNFECESNCEPNRVQGDGSPYRTTSKAYTSNYMNGTWGQDRFANGLTGYGLAQWTYPTRQAGLWSFWKQSGKALDDAEMQCDYAVKELKRDFPELWNLLCTSNDVYTLTKRVCYDFENPAVKNVDARFSAANRIKHEINLNEWQSASPGEPQLPSGDLGGGGGVITSPTGYWPLRGIRGGSNDPGLCNGMDGEDVKVLQALLNARGYPIKEIDGQFGLELDSTVKRFQSDHGLSPDGIVGPLTWAALWKG